MTTYLHYAVVLTGCASPCLQAKQSELTKSASKKAAQLKASSKQLTKLKADITKLGGCLLPILLLPWAFAHSLVIQCMSRLGCTTCI